MTKQSRQPVRLGTRIYVANSARYRDGLIKPASGVEIIGADFYETILMQAG